MLLSIFYIYWQRCFRTSNLDYVSDYVTSFLAKTFYKSNTVQQKIPYIRYRKLPLFFPFNGYVVY
jgi:hypothetical protein